MLKEHELVLKLADFRSPDCERINELMQGQLDWSLVLGLLAYNRMGGVAHYVLRANNIPIPNGFFEFSLFLQHDIMKLRTLAYRKTVAELSAVFNESGLPHAFLKGSVLSNIVYPLGCRVSNDIDILMSNKDLTEVGKVLQKEGFIQGTFNKKDATIVPASRMEIIHARMNFGEVKKYMKTCDMPGLELIEVDINFSLDWTPQGTQQAVETFLQSAEKYQFNNEEYTYSLPKEYFLAHLCVHLFKEAIVMNWIETQRDLGLYKFADIYAFLTDPHILVDSRKLIEIARANHIEKECYYALYNTSLLFPSLNGSEQFGEMLDGLRPLDLAYLDEVIDPTDSSIKYKWSRGFLERFFDMNRSELLVPVMA
ncbi:nucleotidyltransferase family protein [Paenibacillus sp. NPDC058071]|uniref:nucleotidyltransferase family protein n=1 Tax=Paenibacillus sp. NPDC058071 TaxID=3346326 RepID=UPI0036DC3EED